MQALAALHDEVDRRAAQTAAKLRDALRCRRGCSGCCQDELTVFVVEAALIRSRHSDLLKSGTPAAEGQCAFLDEAGACRIYPSRPYVCRTQGLPLRWMAEEGHEARSVCELNGTDEWLVQLPSSSCFELGPFEGRLASLQAGLQGARPGRETLDRVPLRSLFAATHRD